MYSTDLTNLYNITGDQLGAYFGYSICVSDVDGDGGDDIIVGAPLFSTYSKNDASYETGKVYVYLKKEVRNETFFSEFCNCLKWVPCIITERYTYT